MIPVFLKSTMQTVNTTEFRQRLPSYLRRAAAGEEIRITLRGRVIARLLPEEDGVAAARRRLEALHPSSTLRAGKIRYFSLKSIY
jgi:prevent-host-death family protein